MYKGPLASGQITVYLCLGLAEIQMHNHLAVSSRTIRKTGSYQQLCAFTERLTWLTISPRKGSKSQSAVSPEGTTSKWAASRYGFPTQHRQNDAINSQSP
jgi:hypothetical protein